MNDQVYFIGYRPEQFTGWDGSGSASYTSVSATNTIGPNNIGTISLTTSGNVLWKDLNITNLDPVYFCASLYAEFTTGNYGSIVITDGTNAIKIMSINPDDGNNDRLQLSIGTYDSTNRFTQVSSSIVYNNGSNSSIRERQINFFLKFYSSDKIKYDTIDICASSTVLPGVISSVTTITLTNPFTSIKSMYSSYNSSNSIFYYCAVANFDLTGSYIDYTTVVSSGTFDGWSGTVSTLNTYPINSNVTTNGVYSYRVNDQITFSPTKQLTSGTGMMAPKAVFIDSSLSTNENGLGYSATSIVKNSSSSLTYSLGSTIVPSTTVTNYQWVSYQNPSNLSDWSVSDVNSLEFGLKRIS